MTFLPYLRHTQSAQCTYYRAHCLGLLTAESHLYLKVIGDRTVTAGGEGEGGWNPVFFSQYGALKKDYTEQYLCNK